MGGGRGGDSSTGDNIECEREERERDTRELMFQLSSLASTHFSLQSRLSAFLLKKMSLVYVYCTAVDKFTLPENIYYVLYIHEP
jgi:hypothetical protein